MAITTPRGITGLKLWFISDTGVQENTGSDGSPNYVAANHGVLIARWLEQHDANPNNNVYHLVQSKASDGAYQPSYVNQNGVTGVCVDYWRSTSQAVNKALSLIGAPTTDPRGFTAMVVVEMNTVDRNNYVLTLGEQHTSTENIALIVKDGVLHIWDGATMRDTTLRVPSSKCVIVWRGNTSGTDGMVVYLNSVSASASFAAAPSSPATRSGGEVGGAGGGWFKVFEVAVYNNDVELALSGNVGSLIDYAIARHSITVAPAKHIIVDGDTLSEGYGATLNQTFWRRLSDHEGLYVTCHANSTQTVATAAADAQEIDALFSTITTEDWLFCKLGTWSIIGTSGITVYGQLKDYCNARKAADPGADKIVVWTLNLLLSTSTADRDGFNDFLRADFTVPTGSPYVFAAKPGTTYADYLVDIAAHPLIGTNSDAGGTSAPFWLETANPRYHLTDAGYALEVAMMGEGLFTGRASKVQSATITIDDAGPNGTIRLLTEHGLPTIGRHQVMLTVYADEKGTEYLTADGPTGIAIDTYGTLATVSTVESGIQMFVATCDDTGLIDLNWTNEDEEGFLGVILPNGRVVISGPMSGT